MFLEEFMEDLKKEVLNLITKNFPDNDIAIEAVNLTKPPSADLGDYTFACFPLAKSLRKAPVKIAEEVAKNFSTSNLIEKIDAVGAYLNVFINKAKFAQIVCQTVMTQKDTYGSGKRKNKKVMIEYSSPNTNKPLHLGHLRNNILGMAVANILEFSGYDVMKVNLVNDRGIHICKSMLAYQKWGNDATPTSTNTKGDHFVGKYYILFDAELKKEKEVYAQKQNINPSDFSAPAIKVLKDKLRKLENEEEKKALKKDIKELEAKSEKFENNFIRDSELYNKALEMLQLWENGDEQVRALWKKMNSWVMEGFHKTYAKLGCTFDKFYFESDTYSLGKDSVEEGVNKNIFVRRENNSIWVKGEDLKAKNTDLFGNFAPKDKLLLRGDGTSVYITQDIGTTILKHEDEKLDECLFLVGEEQNLHFKTLFAILNLLDFPWAKHCRHISYGMVTLPDGKLKSREGTTVDADELISEMEQRVLEKIAENENVSTEESVKVAEDIALAALKLFLLNISKEKALLFDPHKAIGQDEIKSGKSNAIAFAGDTGPYIQYGYARIHGIFRNVKVDLTPENVDYSLINTEEELALLHKIADFPQIVASAAGSDNPHMVSGYLLELTKQLFKFYNVHSVAGAEENVQKARVLLCQVTAQTIKNGTKLLGINVPERM